MFDIPVTAEANRRRLQSANNCACTNRKENMLTRAPFESEFQVQYQQVVQSFPNSCSQTATSCSYGTPFTLEMEMTVDINGPGLTETQRNEAVEAFIRASNYA